MKIARKEHWNLHVTWSQKTLLVRERERRERGKRERERGKRERERERRDLA